MLNRLRRIAKLIERYKAGEHKVIARISKMVGGVIGVFVGWLFLKVPFIAALPYAEADVTAVITTLITTAIAIYFAPKNAD